MSTGFRKAFVNLFRCFRQNHHQQRRRVSLSCCGANALPNTSMLNPIQNGNETNINNSGMLNSGSETFDLSRHDSYRMHKRSDDNDESFMKGSLKI